MKHMPIIFIKSPKYLLSIRLLPTLNPFGYRSSFRRSPNQAHWTPLMCRGIPHCILPEWSLNSETLTPVSKAKLPPSRSWRKSRLDVVKSFQQHVISEYDEVVKGRLRAGL